VQAKLAEFEQQGSRVVAISFVQPARLKQYLDRRDLTIRVLSDPDRQAYRAFGLGSVSWCRILRPRAIAVYLRLILRGKLPTRPQEDIHQLGGDFLLDASGSTVFGYRSKDPTDRPTPDALLAEIRKMTNRPRSAT